MRAAQIAQCLAHRGCQILFERIIAFNQVHDGFRVGIRAENSAFRAQLVAQLEEIFDNAVMHNHEFAVAAVMRMRVAGGWLAVRRPARMPDTYFSFDGRAHYHFR